MTEFHEKRIVLGVTGGVAAYKAAELSRLLVKAGAQVDVVLTDAGARFVGAPTFQALTGRPVWRSLWDERVDNGMAHIELTRGAAAIMVAPATADFLSRLVHGAADDLLSTLCLARACPLHVAPAMNRQMWDNPATQRNVKRLRMDDVGVFGPAEGEQACGETGEGRMLEASELFHCLLATFQAKSLAGVHVVMTAGPTHEALDPVRSLTNTSSGKMGFALAQACADAGAQVELIAGPVNLSTPLGVRRTDVRSAVQMRAAVADRLRTGGGRPQIFIGVAAVADYRPKVISDHKIKKGGGDMQLFLEPNPDILAEVAAMTPAPFCVGFAAESRDLAGYAEGKRRAKNLQLVIGNLIQDALGGDDTKVALFDDSGVHDIPRGTKLSVARQIVAHMATLFESRHAAR